MQQSILIDCAEQLSARFISAQALQGGDINNVYLLQTTAGEIVVKTNANFQGLFQQEAAGLAYLGAAECIRVPEVLGLIDRDGVTALMLEYIPPHSSKSGFWERFGQQLAALHQVSHDYFGLDQDNYIATFLQDNQQSPSWPSFFITQRLYPQLSIAQENQRIPEALMQQFRALFQLLPELLPEEPPSLIHGDLWNGNFLIDAEQNPVLIDPAICFAAREMDLAMIQLFGGFGPAFMPAYLEAYPCAPGLNDRVQIYQLYYLLIHLNLFGTSYLSAIQRILSRYN